MGNDEKKADDEKKKAPADPLAVNADRPQITSVIMTKEPPAMAADNPAPKKKNK